MREVRLSIDTVYQAGTLGSTNAMRQTGRPSTVPLPSNVALSGAAPQVGVGWRNGSCGDVTHGLPGSRSHRVRPITIAREPPRIAYVSRFGAPSRQVVRVVGPPPDEMRSSIVTDRSARKTRVARRAIRVADGGGQRDANANRVVVDRPSGRRIATAAA